MSAAPVIDLAGVDRTLVLRAALRVKAKQIAPDPEVRQLRKRALQAQAKPAIALRDFIRDGWHVVEPVTPYRHNRHIEVICEHLEAVSRGEIHNLLINISPGHMKSLLTGVFWPAWEWHFKPWTRWLGASYSPALSTRDALKTRRLMVSEWYQREYGKAFAFRGDQNAKTRYENDKTGFRIATSVGGMATGERADRLLVDDPHNARDRERPVARERVLDWWDNSFANRVNDSQRSVRVVIMQRLHDRDLAGHILELGGFEHLMLPSEYESKRATTTTIGLPDWRTREGELLWPEMFPYEVLRQEERRLTSYGYAGQHQQNPIPREGGMFKRDWWQRFPTFGLPKFKRAIITFDTAQKTAISNDFSAMTLWAETYEGTWYVPDHWREREELPELQESMRDFYFKWLARFPLLQIVIEDKNHGTAILQTFSRPDPLGRARVSVSPFPDPESPYERDMAALSKEARAEQVTQFVKAKRVYLPADAPWVADYITEHERFPNGEHDDRVDTTSIALIRFNAPATNQVPFTPGTTGYRR